MFVQGLSIGTLKDVTWYWVTWVRDVPVGHPELKPLERPICYFCCICWHYSFSEFG
jgi:hypothetical protein